MDYGWEDSQLDPLGNFYAHWQELSKRAREVIIENALTIANSSLSLTQCDVIAPIWYHLLHDAGVEVDLRGGNYHITQESETYPSLSEHTWLIVENTLFDPTASQFGNEKHPIKEGLYQTSTMSAEEWFDGQDPNAWRLESQLAEHDNVDRKQALENELARIRNSEDLPLKTTSPDTGFDL